MNISEILYTGELRTKALHIQSGTEIITDAPPDNNGKGEAFSPTDLVATALGSCMMTIMGIAAMQHQFSIEGLKTRITKVMASNPRRISEIIVELHFPHNQYTEKEKRLIEYSAYNCPVAKSLHPDLIQTIKIIYPENQASISGNLQ